jgi:tetratricopeptide (TPR) repeat protein
MTNLGIAEAPGIDVPRVVEKWLRNESSGRWLLIVDNVDNEDVIFEKREGEEDGTIALDLVSCLPKVEHGSILFTTRYKKIALKLTKDLIEIDEMTEEEAVQLLKKNLTNEDFNSKNVKLLLEELCYIPLAISHAAAFMRVNSQPISEYLDMFKSSDEERIGLLGESFQQLSISSPDIPKQVLATWSISFDYVKNDGTTGPLASELLSVMSFMDRQEIPKSLLTSFRPNVLKFQYAKAFGTLKATSLISENDQETFSMHRLVQLSMRCWLKQQNKDRLFAEQAVALLANNFPDGSFKTWKTCSALVVHAESALALSAELSTADVEARARLLSNVATFQSNRGEYLNAEAKFGEVLKLKTEQLGAEDLETLRAADALALVMRHQAKYIAAEDLARQTLSKKEKLLGKEHAETLSSSHIVATILGDRGMHKLAEDQNRKILEARRPLLGPDHPDTLKSGSNLSLSLWELGRFEEAEELARSVLDARAKTLGWEHPDTLEIAGTLGFILEVQGKYAEAEELKRHILDIRQQILGDDHPDTADSWHDMGWILHQQGNYLEAEEYYNRALAAKKKLLGEDHPKTLTTLCNFPVFYCDKGDYEQAESASIQIVQSFERLQGPEHPQTLDALGGMAVIYRHLGKLDTALESAKISIAGREKVIGKDHPWTLPTVSHMGYILTLQNQESRGEEIIRGALAGLESSLGPDHPQTLTSILQLSKNLALQNSASQLEESEALARRALETRTRVLGPDHPYTHKAEYQLARVLYRQQRFEDAAVVCRDALQGLQGSLGTEHPDVTACGMDYSEIMERMSEEDGDDGMGLGLENGAMVVDLRRDSESSYVSNS